MSTMLVIPDEIQYRGTIHTESWMRSIPEEAVWWRTRIWPNEKGHNSVFQLQIDNLDWSEDKVGCQNPWSMRVEIFDGLDKWFFPYDYTFAIQREVEKPFREMEHSIITGRRTYLDILALEPPGPVETGWSPTRQKHAWTMISGWDRHNREWPEHPTDRRFDLERMP